MIFVHVIKVALFESSFNQFLWASLNNQGFHGSTYSFYILALQFLTIQTYLI